MEVMSKEGEDRGLRWMRTEDEQKEGLRDEMQGGGVGMTMVKRGKYAVLYKRTVEKNFAVATEQHHSFK